MIEAMHVDLRGGIRDNKLVTGAFSLFAQNFGDQENGSHLGNTEQHSSWNDVWVCLSEYLFKQQVKM